VPRARRTPIYAEENAPRSNALMTPYNRAYMVSDMVIRQAAVTYRFEET
jgi:hypothetical protein